MHRNKIIKLILVNIFVFLITYVVIDIILGHRKIPYDFNSFRVKHPYYHHGMKPEITQYTVWGNKKYKIHTNSLGMRDSAVREIELKKREKSKRILIMGDSHTEGVGVRYENTFPGILQKKAGPHDIEIFNGAAVSYSQKIYYLRTDHLLNQLNLEIDEVWVFMDISDMQNEIAYEDFIPKQEGILFNSFQKVKDFLEQNSFTYYTITSKKESQRVLAFLDKVKQFDPRYMDNLQQNTVALYEDFFRDFKNDDLLRSPQFHGVGTWYYDSVTIDLAHKGIRLGKRNMMKLDSICKKHDIILKIAVQPWHAQIKKGKEVDEYVTTWENFCKKYQIPFINLFPLFINDQNPYIVIDKYYLRNDNHWNAEGHERVAEFLYDLLSQ